jgi:succinylglutamate desuccinylase
MTGDDLGFTYRAFKNGHVEVRHHGVLATTLRGSAAEKFLSTASDGGPKAQQLMARLTGNYKRGNEAHAKGHPRNRA